MSYSHVEGNARNCGATTIVTGQNFVTINGKLWAVEGDQNTHGDGQLIASKTYVTIGGKSIIVQNDDASPDDAMHSDPKAQEFDSLVDVN